MVNNVNDTPLKGASPLVQRHMKHLTSEQHAEIIALITRLQKSGKVDRDACGSNHWWRLKDKTVPIHLRAFSAIVLETIAEIDIELNLENPSAKVLNPTPFPALNTLMNVLPNYVDDDNLIHVNQLLYMLTDEEANLAWPDSLKMWDEPYNSSNAAFHYSHQLILTALLIRNGELNGWEESGVIVSLLRKRATFFNTRPAKPERPPEVKGPGLLPDHDGQTHSPLSFVDTIYFGLFAAFMAGVGVGGLLTGVIIHFR